jgi:hypothetical protein
MSGPALRTALLLAVLSAAAASPEGAWADAQPRQLYLQPSPLASLVDALPEMPVQARLELAVIIVDGLVQAYEDELEQALREARERGPGQRDLARWQQGMSAAIAELGAWRWALYAAEDVQLRVAPHHQLLLLIDGRPLWIAWPRLSAQRRLEQELAAEFCRRQECPGPADEDPATLALQPPVGVEGKWTLSQFHPPTWESAEGVRCEFPDFTRLGERERVCRDLIADLQLLAAALRLALQGGERIQWSRISMHPARVGTEHRITVNDQGDYLAVFVPALASQSVDWREARRWLEARVKGVTATATVLRGDAEN